MYFVYAVCKFLDILRSHLPLDMTRLSAIQTPIAYVEFLFPKTH